MLSRYQIHAIETSVRVMSAVSVTSSFFVILSFLWGKLFQTPVNRLMFYATWGNVLANVGTMIGGAGISHGAGSSLCRCQAFLLQWFLPTNALWILCLAINVYLTASHKYRPSELKRLEWRYLIMCYIVPLIPAFAFLFVETKASGPVYGDAVIWCWIRPEWQAFRFAFFFGPIWLTIIMTIAILLYQGIEIYSKRMKIKKLSVDAVHEISDKHHRRDTATSVQAVAPLPSIVATRADNGPGNASTFESQPSSGDVQPLGEGDTSANERTPPKTDLSTRETPERTPETTPESARSNINHGQLPTRKPSTLTLGPTFYATGAAQDESRSNYEQHGTPVSSGTTDARRNDLGLDELENRSAASSAPTAYAQVRSHDGASLGPTRTSSLSQNRTWRTRLPILRPLQTADRHTATYLYMKRVSLFFLSLLLTWTPSTINRIHRVSNPDDPVFGLALLSAVVLSLQGFWNLIVYISTSFDAIKTLCAACRVKFRSYTEV
ncbi:hypothetical protein, variant 2 [Blastomyces dermatitidis ATCC 26199]|nr:hypothetical protein BDFG_08047 [Blastomyces dermatitidis ATCC 26199]EQL29319.1 hypothetical protein, variant 1 [Blastomyces dermatitidis ATCC 26199]EQL29320.1 hypothetical protein, variant 2 [Blastomyces dermatitidis ATCC 26199]